MEKNWYILYTRPGREKKVAALLTKRKVTNFHALNHKETESAKGRKMTYVPLFTSYVFVKTISTELERLKQVGQILSIVYWKGRPAIISENEINLMKVFLANYANIKLTRSKVVENEVVNSPSYFIDGNISAVKNKIMKVNLPSLGFMMSAETETDSEVGSGISMAGKPLMPQKLSLTG